MPKKAYELQVDDFYLHAVIMNDNILLLDFFDRELEAEKSMSLCTFICTKQEISKLISFLADMLCEKYVEYPE